MSIELTVYGKPQPQGSSRAFIPKGHTRPIITTDNTRLKPWRQQISETLMAMRPAIFDRDTPVEVTMNFYFVKPKSAAKRRGMTVKPDVDKLVRAIFDSLTGIVVQDDAQIVEHHARKHYGGPERVEIRIAEAV